MKIRLYATIYNWTKSADQVFVTSTISDNVAGGKIVSFELDIPMEKLFPADLDLGTIYTLPDEEGQDADS